MKLIPIFSRFPRFPLPFFSRQADYFYVVAEGQFEVTVSDASNEESGVDHSEAKAEFHQRTGTETELAVGLMN